MSKSTCAVMVTGESSSSSSSVTREVTICVNGKVVSMTIETTTVNEAMDKFKIISGISSIIKVSGGGQCTVFLRERLDVTLPGTVLLIERDGNWRRVLEWFYHYGLSLQQYNRIRIGLDVPDVYNGGIQYWFEGMDGRFWVYETVLERKWSGRLYIQQYRGKPLMFLGYFWKDMVLWFSNWSSRVIGQAASS